MTPDRLERLTDRRLQSLPLPVAPPSLLPRVMGAVRRLSAKPWYARTWFTWPLAGQLLSAVVVLSIVIGIWMISPMIQTVLDSATARASAEVLSPFSGVIERGHGAVRVARLFWHAGVHPIVTVLIAPVLLMFAACAAFGVALDRVALGGASRS